MNKGFLFLFGALWIGCGNRGGEQPPVTTDGDASVAETTQASATEAQTTSTEAAPEIGAPSGTQQADASTELRLLGRRNPFGPGLLPPAGFLRFPIHTLERAIIGGPTVGQDHNPDVGGGKMSCRNYAGQGFPFCYNEHDGTDYLLVGGFPTMDHYATRVVAAADGVVEAVDDGHYDRCQADPTTGDVTCNGHEMQPNKVVIRHANGYSTSYYHLKKNSIVVSVGQQVQCGQVLAEVGSSGHSSMPHLHFGLNDPSGALIDPYAGKASQTQSYWLLQTAPDGLPGDVCPGQLQAVVDCAWSLEQNAEKCGTDAVTDALQCGASLVTSATACGTNLVTNAALCGSDLVASAEKCGSDLVTDAGQCGADLVTDAAICGAQTFGSAVDCLRHGVSGVFNCTIPNTCSVPRTCSVARTCQVPRSCTVAKTCFVANTCQVPKSCQVFRCR